MPVVNELIRSEADGAISFGNYKLDTKSKLEKYILFDFSQISNIVEIHTRLRHLTKSQSLRRTALLYMNLFQVQQLMILRRQI